MDWKARWRLANFLEKPPGSWFLYAAMAAALVVPVLLFKLPAALLIVGGIFGFWGGYSFARSEWRKRGYVPRFDDTSPD